MFLSLSFLPVNFSSCGTPPVLGVPRQKAAELLRKGDTGFIFNAELPAGFAGAQSVLKDLCRIHPAAPFYAGLLAGDPPIHGTVPAPGQAENARSGRELQFLLFCAALESPSPAVREEAVLKLVPLILEHPDGSAGNRGNAGDTAGYPLETAGLLDSVTARLAGGEGETCLIILKAACLYSQGRYAETAGLLSPVPADAGRMESWGKPLALFAAWRSRSGGAGNGAALEKELLSFLSGDPPPGTRAWTYREALSLEGLPYPGTDAVLRAKLSPGSYRDSLAALRPALSGGGSVFFLYPGLAAELGRAYLYTPELRGEGAEVLSSWAALLDTTGALALPGSVPAGNGEEGAPGGITAVLETMDPGSKESIRYTVLYYLARIKRAEGELAASSGYFRRARGSAPDGLQSDACTWYLLTNALDRGLEEAVRLILDTMPQWNDMAYFEDILDLVSSRLSARREWETLLEIFQGLENRAPGASLAQYAWILGRAAEEGYLGTGRGAGDFFRTAFNGEASLYYRTLAAARLGRDFAPAAENTGAEAAAGNAPEGALEFLLGFFEYGASSYALPYIHALEEGLPVPGLRKVAKTLAGNGRWRDSLGLVSRYTGRDGYRINREDLRLLYPRPFRELIEGRAREEGLAAELLYALIRTESHFDPGIVSRSGAVGLAQIMAPTAGDMAGRIARQGGPDYRGAGGIDLKNPETNVRIGAFYLRYLMEQMGSPMPALLAYNGGMGRMRRWLAEDKAQGSLPHDIFLETVGITETRGYGRLVLAAAAVYGYLYYGKTMQEAVPEIYPPGVSGG